MLGTAHVQVLVRIAQHFPKGVELALQTAMHMGRRCCSTHAPGSMLRAPSRRLLGCTAPGVSHVACSGPASSCAFETEGRTRKIVLARTRHAHTRGATLVRAVVWQCSNRRGDKAVGVD